MCYEVDKYGSEIGEFTRFNNGCVAFVQSFDDIYDHHDFNRIVNHVRGERMENYSHESDHLIYHGEFNEKREARSENEKDGASSMMQKPEP